MSSSSTPLSPALEKRLDAQVDAWRRDLVNLDRRQKLVYFKHTKTASLEIAYPGPELLQKLVDSPTLLSVEEETPGRRSQRMGVSGKTETELTASCRRLDLTAQQVFADRGYWTLYLGLGMLRWIDPADEREVDAPVVLCPVELKRSGSQAPYYVSRNEDDVVVNPALRLHLEQEFGITLPDLDLDDPDVPGVLAVLERAIAGRPGWHVQQRSVMTTFSFHKEAIYRDLHDHESSVVSHPIVQMVALGADAPSAAQFSFDPPGSSGSLDREKPPEDLVSILDADSSQRACIIAARQGRSFVMDGPPGTGKSQTIANIVAELMSAGRRVLFVSEKAAALDVVRDRLASKGLGDFLLELHSHSATRKEVVKQLDEALTQRVTARGAFSEGEAKRLRRSREELTDYAEAMNETRGGLGRSLFEVLGRLMAIAEHEVAPEDPEHWSGLSATLLEEVMEVAGRLSRAWRPVSEGDSFLWRGMRSVSHSTRDVDQALAETTAFAAAVERLVERSSAVDEDLLLGWRTSLESARARAELLELLEVRPAVPDDWLSLAEPSELRERVRRLQRVVREHEQASTSLIEIVGEERVDQVDPDASAAILDLDALDVVHDPGPKTTSLQLASAADFLQQTPLLLAPVAEDVRQLGAILGVRTEDISLARAEELGHLAALGGAAALPERAWLNPAVQAALDESVRALRSVVELVTERRAAIEEVFKPSALENDLAGLQVRFRDTHTGMRRMGKAAREDRKLLRSITVSGKSDKTIRARLDEAVAWQKAERSLAETEREHAERLGAYYHETATDFGRVATAIETARRAIELAGNDLNAGPMADQLGRDGKADPRLTVAAQRVLDAVRGWREQAVSLLGEETTRRLSGAPLETAADRASTAERSLRPLVAAAEHVAVAASRDVTVEEAAEAHRQSLRLSRAQVELLDSYDEDSSVLGELYDGLTTDWGAVEKALDWNDDLRRVVAGPLLAGQVERTRSPAVRASEMRQRVDEYVETRAQWLRWFNEERATQLGAEVDAHLVDAGELLSDMRQSCVTDLAEWDAYQEATSELAEHGLARTLGQLVERRAPDTAVEPTVEWALLQAWSESLIATDARLRRHRSADREARVQAFKEMDRGQVERSHINVAAACSARRPSSMTGGSAQLIRREAQKKTRHLPIRELLARTHEVVQELKPCFMMSPLSVSQFLPGDMAFDAIIFDEASQVLPSDAINCIYRGSQLIVAGDERQLPPTSFFAQATSDEDVDEELDIFESVLKSCKSALPSLPLTWHYRSQHESLITYSNYRFYAPDGQALQTFPGATFESPDLGVASYRVNGTYRRGTTRDNPIEAEAVVDRLLFHRQHHPELSIGVVTFSSAQELAVSNALEARSQEEPVLEGMLDDHDRLHGFFVKNLENVQGDERDIILFSVGYGPDEHGKLTMNFGPVTRDGGWRRLNVAVTRARRRVEVVCSLRAGDIRESGNQSLGHLRGYLDFADRGLPALGVDIDDGGGATESPFEDDVLQAITGWGYDVATQVGSAGYRIDLAVRHPDRPGEYALAVECDGAAYHSGATARDRDRLRESVLRGLGWNVHRIWGISWYRDRRAEAEKLRSAIEAAVSGVDEAPRTVQVETFELEVEELDPEARPEWAEPYTVSDARPRWTHHSLGEVEARPVLSDYLQHVLQEEVPVHVDLVHRRVRDAFGVGRVGTLIKQNIDFAATRLKVGGRRVTLDEDGFFRAGDLRAVRAPADDETVRSAGQTPPEELDWAVWHVVQDAVLVEDEGVVTAVRRLFGWKRAGGDIQAAVKHAIERCLAEGSVERTPRGELRVT